MEVVLFSIVGIAIYFAADRILMLVEKRLGRPLPNRSVIYFVIFMVLILLSFEIIQRFIISA